MLAICVAGLLACGSGCAPMAQVTHWSPAIADVEGLHEIAVLDPSGDQGDVVSAQLESRLGRSRQFEVLENANLDRIQQVAHSDAAGECRMLRHAREAGIDAVVIADVVATECRDEPLQPRLRERLRFRNEIRRNGQPLQRTASVTINFRLLDTQTGEVRYEEEITRTTSQTGADLPTEDELLATLAGECADEFANALTPHETSGTIELARGPAFGLVGGLIRSGNRSAAAGDWVAAETQWRAALEQSPECDAALYNLAIAAAQRRDYAAAEDLAMEALRIEHSEVYAKGLAGIRRDRTGFEASRRPREDRMTLATYCRWP